MDIVRDRDSYTKIVIHYISFKAVLIVNYYGVIIKSAVVIFMSYVYASYIEMHKIMVHKSLIIIFWDRSASTCMISCN